MTDPMSEDNIKTVTASRTLTAHLLVCHVAAWPVLTSSQWKVSLHFVLWKFYSSRLLKTFQNSKALQWYKGHEYKLDFFVLTFEVHGVDEDSLRILSQHVGGHQLLYSVSCLLSNIYWRIVSRMFPICKVEVYCAKGPHNLVWPYWPRMRVKLISRKIFFNVAIKRIRQDRNMSSVINSLAKIKVIKINTNHFKIFLRLKCFLLYPRIYLVRRDFRI